MPRAGAARHGTRSHWFRSAFRWLGAIVGRDPPPRDASLLKILITLAREHPGSSAALVACLMIGTFAEGFGLSALLPLTSVLEGGGKFVQSCKFAAEFYGLPAGPVRKPMRPLKKELARELREVLITAKTTIQQILSEDAVPAEQEVPHVRAVN